jgi:hypothetical protein
MPTICRPLTDAEIKRMISSPVLISQRWVFPRKPLGTKCSIKVPLTWRGKLILWKQRLKRWWLNEPEQVTMKTGKMFVRPERGCKNG